LKKHRKKKGEASESSESTPYKEPPWNGNVPVSDGPKKFKDRERKKPVNGRVIAKGGSTNAGV